MSGLAVMASLYVQGTVSCIDVFIYTVLMYLSRTNAWTLDSCIYIRQIYLLWETVEAADIVPLTMQC